MAFPEGSLGNTLQWQINCGKTLLDAHRVGCRSMDETSALSGIVNLQEVASAKKKMMDGANSEDGDNKSSFGTSKIELDIQDKT